MKLLGKIIRSAAIILLVSGLAYLLIARYFVDFKTETKVLLIPRNEIVATNYQKLLGNVIELSRTNPFQEKLGGSVDKQLFDSESRFYLETKVLSNSGFIVFEGYSADKELSEMISKNAATLMGYEISSYYNIKNDLNFFVIESGKSTRNFSLLVALISLLLGIGISLLLQYISVNKSTDKIFEKTKSLSSKKISSIFSNMKISDKDKSQVKTTNEDIPYFLNKGNQEKSNKKDGSKDQSEKAKFLEKLDKTRKEPKKETLPSFLEKKSFAPGNLPVADDSIIRMFGDTKNEGHKLEEKKEEDTAPRELYKEATSEEVKERLNRLLGGM